jgi:hypothetical protein
MMPVAAGLIALLLAAPRVAATQVEIDRIASRVGDRIVTQSDIRQARALGLADDTSSDASTQRALENRLLILHELSRAAALPPSGPADLEARRAEWAARLGGEGAVPGLLRQAGMTDGDLDGWLRDDLRIRAYLRRQFGMLGDVERSRAMQDWLARLRQRADLPQ